MQSWHKYSSALTLLLTASLLSGPRARAQSPTPAPATPAQSGAPAPNPAAPGEQGAQMLGQTSSSHPLFTPLGAAAASVQPAAKKKHVSARDRDKAENLSAEGTKALLAQDPRKAVDDFHRAGELDPNNPRYAADESIAQEHLVTQLVQLAEKARLLGFTEDAQKDLAEAFHLDPHNPVVTQHYADMLDAKHEAAEDAAFDRTSEVKFAEPPVTIQPAPGVHSFHIKGKSQDIVRQVLNAYGVQPGFESSVKNEPIHFDADDVNYAAAAQMLTLATGTFFVPLDPARVLVVLDSKENRDKFERKAMETIYLPGLTENDRTQLTAIVKNVFQAENATLEASHGTMTIRAPQRDLNALNRTITDLIQGSSEILLDVKMYELDLTHERVIGGILPTSSTLFNIPSEVSSIISSNSSLVQEIISAGLASPTDYTAIAAILIASGEVTGTPFNQPFGYFGGGITATGFTFSGGTANGQLTASEVHSLDQMQLRAEDQQDEEVRSGTRYPIITSSYSNLAGSSSISIPGISSAGVSSALQNLGISASSLTSTSETIPQVQYEDLGLTLHVTPHITGNGDVSLKLDLKLDSLEGSTLNDIPVLDDREVQAVTALRPGSSALIVSHLSKQDSDAVTGIPGLSEIPGLQQATNSDTTKNVTELAIIVTPHVVRRVHRDRSDRMILMSQH